MDIIDLIASAQGGQGMGALSRKYNVDESRTRAAIDQLAPAVMAGIRRETESADGLAGLVKALASGKHARYLEGDDQGMTDDGNAILGHIFGSKDVSRGVAARASEATGVDVGTLKQMLPAIAAMVMGALGKNTLGGASAGGSEGLGGMLGQLLGGGGAAAAPGRQGPAGGIGDVFGQLLGGAAGGAGASSGGGQIGDILGGLFGGEASPEVREQATKRIGGAFGEMLGGGTATGAAADRLLDSVGHRKKKLDK